MWLCAHDAVLVEARSGHRIPWSWVTGSCELICGCQNLCLPESRTHPKLLGRLSSPLKQSFLSAKWLSITSRLSFHSEHHCALPTCPVCSVSSLFMRYIKKNLQRQRNWSGLDYKEKTPAQTGKMLTYYTLVALVYGNIKYTTNTVFEN